MASQKDHSVSSIQFTGEPIGRVGWNRSDGHRIKLFEESVTFTVQLDPEDHAAMVPPLDRTWMIGSWPVHEYQIPIIVGISSGVLVLLLVIAALVLWRCCHIHHLREKAFAMHVEGGRTPVIHSPSSGSSYPSMLAMSVSPSKPTSPSLASHNHLESNACELVRLTDESPNTQRRIDTVVMAVSVGDDSQYLKQVERHSCEDMSLVGCGNYIAFDIPSFYDESLNTSSMSASSNAVLDVSWSNGGGSCNELKTRSLPAWARNKGSSMMANQHNSRPAISGKEVASRSVMTPSNGNSAKRCHQGLRHEAAALIALNQAHKMAQTQANNNGDVICDPVQLVGHNEAVIVFNERTAL